MLRQFSGRCRRAWRLGALLALTAAIPAHAMTGETRPDSSDTPDSLAAALGASRWSGFAKLMTIADDKKGGRPDQSTLGVGGRLGVATGVWHGWQLQAAAYTTQDLGTRHADPRRTDAYLFDLDKRPYTLLGEAQLKWQQGAYALTLGRQEFFSPIINSYEYRIIPNLFEAATLQWRPDSSTTATLAYVDKMSGLDGLVTYSHFRSMAQQTYTSLKVDDSLRLDARNGDTLDPSRAVGHHGVWVAGFERGSQDQLRLWLYHGIDSLDTLYAEGRRQWPLTATLGLKLEGQYYRVGASGGFRHYLARQGLNASYDLSGIKASLSHAPSGVTVGLAMNRYGGNDRTVTAYGNWGGYPEFVVIPYLFAEGDSASAIARSRLAKLTTTLDLAPYGLPQQALILGHARINLDPAILANSDITVNSLIYRAKLNERLSTRVMLESRNSGNSRYNNEYATFWLRYDF